MSSSASSASDHHQRHHGNHDPAATETVPPATNDKKAHHHDDDHAKLERGDMMMDDHDGDNTELVAHLTLEDIVEKRSERGLPIAKFVDDVQQFSDSFVPVPASAEHMIGAYDQLHAQYRRYEGAFRQRMTRLQEKIPELEKSLALIGHLNRQRQQAAAAALKADGNDGSASNASAVCTVRYSLADNLYGRADVNTADGRVYLWLGANVMLEYAYEDALAFLQSNHESAVRDVSQLRDDLGLVRDQIVTCEVTMSRIYNWDVRRRRQDQQQQQQQPQAAATGSSPPVEGAGGKAAAATQSKA